ncbi:unnamed protein product [Ectocarpus sp. 4 AP-2014]
MLFAKATIARAVEAALPDGMTATDEMVEAINKSCAEFVNLLSTEASAKAKASGKNPVMSNEDVVEAVKVCFPLVDTEALSGVDPSRAIERATYHQQAWAGGLPYGRGGRGGSGHRKGTSEKKEEEKAKAIQRGGRGRGEQAA